MNGDSSGCSAASRRATASGLRRRLARFSARVTSAGGQAEDLGRRQVVEAHRVVRVVDGSQERDEDADLGLAVEPGRAAEPPGNARHVQRADVRVGVAIAAHENRVLTGGPPGSNGRADPVGDRIGLVRTRRVAGQLDRAVRGLGSGEARARAQPLVQPLARLQPVGVVVADEPVRRVEDRLPAAVVVDEHDARGARVGRPETEDVAERGSPEAVDRLVVVADDRDVAVIRGQQPDELPLGVVRVLELVHQDVPIPTTLLVEDRRVIPQEPEREADLVAEVEPIAGSHQPLVGGVGRRQLGLVGGALGQRRVERGCRGRIGQALRNLGVPIRADVLVAQPAEERDEGGQEAGRVAERAVSVQRQLEEVLSEEDHLLRAAEDGRTVAEAGLEGMLAQEPVAKGVERADLRVVVPVRHEPVDPLDHLVRGPIREGQCQDLGWLRALLGDQPGDPAGDDRRLARTGSGHDQQRPVAMGHRLALAGGEIGQQRRLDAQMRPPGAGRRRRRQLLEERELVRRWDDRWHFLDGTGWPIHPAVIHRLRDTLRVAANQPR